MAAFYVESEQCIPEGGRGNGEGFHIADFVLTVMVSDGVGTEHSPTSSLTDHTNSSELPGARRDTCAWGRENEKLVKPRTRNKWLYKAQRSRSCKKSSV